MGLCLYSRSKNETRRQMKINKSGLRAIYAQGTRWELDFEKSALCFCRGLQGSECFNKHLPFACVHHTFSTFKHNLEETGLSDDGGKPWICAREVWTRRGPDAGNPFCIISGTWEPLIHPDDSPRPNRLIPLMWHYLAAAVTPVISLETSFTMDCQGDKWESPLK